MNKLRGRRAISLIYVSFMLVMLLGFASLAVDWGRAQLAKTQLQQAADAAARYGAMGLENGAATAKANAIAAALDNSADGVPVVLDPTNDVLFGTWNSSTHTFTQVPAGQENSATAVKIVARRLASRGNAVPLFFAGLVGKSNIDITTTSIAVYTSGQQSQMDVPSTSNPYLAGMPAGTVANPNNPHNNPDYAGSAGNWKQSPTQVTTIPVTPGKQLTFDAVNGGANNFSSQTLYTPDGNTAWVTDNLVGNENGFSDVHAPINAVMGVFLGPNDPRTDGTATPSALDFSSASSRNFSNLSPQLKQVFFIGDGRKDDGSTQTFTVPDGATRFYIGTMDQYEWNNNVGDYSVTVHKLGTVSLVK